MRPFHSSLTRIARLEERTYALERRPREQWGDGDYVAGEVLSAPAEAGLELPSGRVAQIVEGDVVVSALGRRAATLEVVGDWKAVGDDGRFHLLSGGGILGRYTSKSPLLPALPELAYRGHVTIDGAARGMRDFVEAVAPRDYDTPTVLIVGTSMSAGKTTAARNIIRQLARLDLRILGAKLTGAGRRHDVQSMADAGAEAIFDFVDVGLPSTVCPEEEYRAALSGLLSRMAAVEADLAVIEAGASPLEPYNGRAAVDAIDHAVRCTVLCASDPYAVLGVMEGFGRRPDFVSGITTNTEAGIALVRRLTGLPAINVRDRSTWPRLTSTVRKCLGV